MAEEGHGGGEPSSSGSSGGTGARSPIIFVTDTSLEAVRIAETLTRIGYVVVDAPVAQLAARVAASRPHVILVDVDAEGAIEAIGRLRKLPGSGAIDFVYLGTGDGPVRTAEDALLDGAAFFVRPVDVAGLLRKIEALTGGPARLAGPSFPSMPASIPVSRPSSPSLPAPGARSAGPPLPMSTPSLADLVAPRSFASFGAVSNELQELLAEAELRAEVLGTADASLPTPEEEIEAVLPADVLASLDEPLDGDLDDDASPAEPRPAETSTGRDATGAHAKGSTTGAARKESAVPPDASPAHTPAVPQTHERPARSDVPDAEVVRLETPKAAPVAQRAGIVLGPGDARRCLAEAIARRDSGALCFDTDGVVRRLVLRDGDLVTAASGSERESLVAFLGITGELPRDEVQRLASKVPPHGRHAGAALVAHGWLRQDQLWIVLRAHAEWLAASALKLTSGICELESDPPGRLRGEPSVFGASTGAEIFVELVRRSVTPEEALERLGGETSKIGNGPNHLLFVECNLPHGEAELLGRARGGTVGDLLARSSDQEILAVLHALALLGVVEIVPTLPARPKRLEPSADVLVLDEDAVRARVRARLEIVEDGDYFSVLGVARDATGYEIRRAFLEHRRAFEPTRVLTPRTADLADGVRKIVTVLEEAYEILKDPARRERYRQAIEARPE